MHWKQSGLKCHPEIQNPRVCINQYVIEASNCIEAANLDSVEVLNLWHAQEATYA